MFRAAIMLMPTAKTSMPYQLASVTTKLTYRYFSQLPRRYITLTEDSVIKIRSENHWWGKIGSGALVTVAVALGGAAWTQRNDANDSYSDLEKQHFLG